MNLKQLGHIGFVISDMEKALQFYCEGLGLKQIYVMTYGDLYEQVKKDIEKGGITEKAETELHELLDRFEGMRQLPWHTYLQIVPGQCLELFYTYDKKSLPQNISDQYGYQHCSIIVEDINAARAELISKGIQPDTEIQMGPDHTLQFWIHDPDGNQIELMEYTKDSLQVVKTIES